MSMTVIFSFESVSLPRKADRFPMRFRMGPTTTNIQCGSVVVVLHLSAFSNASSRVALICIKSFDVSGIEYYDEPTWNQSVSIHHSRPSKI